MSALGTAKWGDLENTIKVLTVKKLKKPADIPRLLGADQLKNLLNLSDKLKRDDPKDTKSGMGWTFATWNAQDSITTTKYKLTKRGAQCYETAIPNALLGEERTAPILISQTLAPCAACQKSYAAWAYAKDVTIVVYYMDPFGDAVKDSWFVFTRTGNYHLDREDFMTVFPH